MEFVKAINLTADIRLNNIIRFSAYLHKNTECMGNILKLY